MSRPRISVPDSVQAGETFSIRALISHVMENGQRRDSSGQIVPRDIINRFECSFNGEPVFACDLDTAVAANPYFEFPVRLDESGTLHFVWTEDNGTAHTAEHEITVT